MRLLLLVLVIATTIYGQQISPIAQEFKGTKAHCEFQVGNAGLSPEDVTVTFASFDVTAAGHDTHIRPLDPGISIALKKPTFRLGPRQQYFVDFTVQCSTVPCRALAFAHFTAPHTQGLNIAYHLSTTVYLCGDRQKGCRKQQLASMGYIVP